VEPEITSLLGVAALAVAHLTTPLLGFLRLVPRSRLLSAAGGVSVAYVFVHLLPEIAAAQEAVDAADTGLFPDLERHAYVLALAGTAIFYGLERAALRSRAERTEAHVDGETSPQVFALSIGSFALYNGIVGYLVVREAEGGGLVAMALFALALALHLVVVDLGLRQHHRRRYDRLGRPLLVVALLVGWGAAAATELHEAAVGLAIAFLGGGVILNVLKEELPEERESRFGAFALGAAAYGGLLLVAA
jgi:hypothetical protein